MQAIEGKRPASQEMQLDFPSAPAAPLTPRRRRVKRFTATPSRRTLVNLAETFVEARRELHDEKYLNHRQHAYVLVCVPVIGLMSQLTNLVEYAGSEVEDAANVWIWFIAAYVLQFLAWLWYCPADHRPLPPPPSLVASRPPPSPATRTHTHTHTQTNT